MQQQRTRARVLKGTQVVNDVVIVRSRLTLMPRGHRGQEGCGLGLGKGEEHPWGGQSYPGFSSP